jgi:hypothetical protein
MSIPLSMLLSFIVMQMIGMTMNMVVLFSLILALGMLVDNAIVVVENIYRHMEQGFDNFEAATTGHRRGGGTDHRIDADHAGRVLPDAVLAGHCRRVHELPAAHADHHARQLAVRRAGDRAAAVRDVHAARQRRTAPAAAGRALDAARRGGRLLLGIAASSVLAAVLLAGSASGCTRCTASSCRRGALVPGPGCRAWSTVREAAALGARPSRHRHGRRGRRVRQHHRPVLGVQPRQRVLSRIDSAGVGDRADRRAERHGRVVHGRISRRGSRRDCRSSTACATPSRS